MTATPAAIARAIDRAALQALLRPSLRQILADAWRRFWSVD